MYKGARMTAGLGSPTYKRASRCSLVAKVSGWDNNWSTKQQRSTDFDMLFA